MGVWEKIIFVVDHFQSSIHLHLKDSVTKDSMSSLTVSVCHFVVSFQDGQSYLYKLPPA